MRKKLIVGNWKMNLNLEEARRLILDIRLTLAEIKDVEVAVCPSFLHLAMVGFQLPTNIKLGAQNCFWERFGQYTGEISPVQLKNLRCDYVILGHSERRQYLKENDVMIAQKLEAVLASGMTPILCVGETKEEREKKLTAAKLDEQVQVPLEDLTREQIRKIVIAYEPVWAIGKGLAARPQDAQQVAKFIRKILDKKYDEKTAEMVRILYGGSVDSKNIIEFVSQPSIDGALVGRASLKAEEFVDIVKNVTEVKNASRI
ncbi:MAG: triose-phosphate isomerase [Patescibacteria group bacterium]